MAKYSGRDKKQLAIGIIGVAIWIIGTHLIVEVIPSAIDRLIKSLLF